MPNRALRKLAGAFKYRWGTNILWTRKIALKRTVMRYKPITPKGLEYLNNKPKTIWWEIIAGPPGYKLNALQDHDLVFDKFDYKIRQLPM